MVVERLRQELGDGYDVQKVTVTKNNGVELTGYSIRKAGDAISPTIYADGDDEETANKVLATYKDNAATFTSASVTQIMRSAEAIYERVIPAAINRKSNAETLKRGVIYDELLDLAIIYKVKLVDTRGGVGTVTITRELAENAGLDMEKLRKAARDNMRKYATVKNIFDTMQELGDVIGVNPPQEMAGSPMCIITANNYHYGAGVLAADDILDKLHDMLKADRLYVIPSTIHELIVTPTYMADVASLRELIKCVNVSEVDPAEKLSDELYIHTAGQGLRFALA